MTKYQFWGAVGCTVASLFIIANIAANHTSVLIGVLAIAITAYGWGWRRGRDRTDIEAWLAADMPTQLGALTIAHLEHPAVTAVVVTRGPRLDGKALYTITPKGDTND